MNCDEFVRQVDDLVDGELLRAEASALQTHASGCTSCAALMIRTRQLQARAAALPRERRPRHDLWPGIAERLDKTELRPRLQQRPWFRAIAAGVALVAVFAGGMLAERVVRETGVETQPHIARQGHKAALPGLQEARRFLPASHVELIEGGRNGALNADSEQELLRNLLLVNLAIRQVETAAEDDPTNANLRELLSSLYLQENRILAQAERLRTAGQAPTRTGI